MESTRSQLYAESARRNVPVNDRRIISWWAGFNSEENPYPHDPVCVAEHKRGVRSGGGRFTRGA